MECVFCKILPESYLTENEHFFAIRDIHPVTSGHSLIIAKRHVRDFFELNTQEMDSLHDICLRLKELLDAEVQPDGYNLGMNCGSAAGQSVFHFHMHCIPRFSKDKKPLHGLREYLKEIL